MKTKGSHLVLNILFIFISVLLIYGIFSPWITVATIFKVSGTSSIYGLFVFISAFMFIVYGLSGLIKNSVLNEYQNLIRKVTLLISTFTLLNLMYLIYRYLDAIREFNKITDEATTSTESLGELGQSLDNLFQNITNAIKPTIGIGFYISLIGLVVGLILSIPVVDNKNIRLDKFGKYFSACVAIIIFATCIFIFLQSKTKSTSLDSLRESSSPNATSPVADSSETTSDIPEIDEIQVSKGVLTLVWNPVFDENNLPISKYEYRMKSSFMTDWFEPILCDYSDKSITKDMKSTDTFSCDWSFEGVDDADVKAFAMNKTYGLDFQLRAFRGDVPGEWSPKPYVFYLYEHPEFLN